ncbi:MAG: DUF4260 domain-containing protein [Actinomycetota bacterium]|nr:DUF4260 domain-containing protein [Actinomycetota bacterium]
MSALALSLNAPPRTAVGRGFVLLAGLAAGAGAVVLLGPWALALWLLPDLAMLPGITSGAARDGRLAPRAVPIYNAVHTYVGPLVLVAAGVLTGPVVLGLGLIWLSHVSVDRGAGYGLRNADGSRRG